MRTRTRLALALAALLTGGCSSRIPVPAELAEEGLGDAVRGRQLVERAVEAHGGRAAWEALGDVSFRLEDDWHGVATPSAPWPVDDPALLLYSYDFSKNKGRIEFVEDPTIVWGHDSVEGWVEQSGVRVYEDVEDATFAVPTEAYFVALPFKFLDPGVALADAGPREHEGRTLDTVLVTFGEGIGAVQDRYLAYFDPETHRLAYVTFTVAEQSDLLEGDAAYVEWQQVEGLLLPERIEIGAIRPVPMDAHTLTVSDVNLHARVDPAKYEKPDAR